MAQPLSMTWMRGCKGAPDFAEACLVLQMPNGEPVVLPLTEEQMKVVAASLGLSFDLVPGWVIALDDERLELLREAGGDQGVVNADTAARFLEVSRPTVYRLAQNGDLEATGSRPLRVTVKSLCEYLASGDSFMLAQAREMARSLERTLERPDGYGIPYEQIDEWPMPPEPWPEDPAPELHPEDPKE
ncbi:helix-turn-helix domain-containing protein [Olsenella sp. YH-ols2217]|uniref:Helix-turn-helix domain-containing protein n=1 Tax=Kribbibacterium absianum TaxID=3044210 RepID=A0ABT6ZLS8_9ACTN|nr:MULTISPECIES: helix-turn-helix domain-containing protein [unclassified Olsenella]MDJ1121814.1 helix-turn-helix domain-containing protein [Olsenella sp. YH-ols2216]MDJ1129822.1 helix-turn-helix domain-containing protein [Olsenella sp. YH-ols2217]